MKVTGKSPNARQCKVFDVMGKQVPHVNSYDTETEEVTVWIKGQGGEQGILVKALPDGKKEPALVTFTLPGSYLTINNKRIKKT